MTKSQLPNDNEEIWEDLYYNGLDPTYPWDDVVRFVKSNYKKFNSASSIRVLELGFGSGCNVWFFAREGFETFGIEASKSALRLASDKLDRDSLSARLSLGDFRQLPYDDGFFDFIVDRCSSCCLSKMDFEVVVNEVHRCLKLGGMFYYSGYPATHPNVAASTTNETDQLVGVGALQNVGRISFYSQKELQTIFERKNLVIKKIEKKETTNLLDKEMSHQEWVLWVEKT